VAVPKIPVLGPRKNPYWGKQNKEGTEGKLDVATKLVFNSVP
jgi:hypothetical protein